MNTLKHGGYIMVVISLTLITSCVFLSDSISCRFLVLTLLLECKDGVKQEEKNILRQT